MGLKSNVIKAAVDEQGRQYCPLCPKACRLSEGQSGFCATRQLRGDKVIPLCYGKISSLALDRIEKKPLARFRPGSYILSVGALGCNMSCPFCQNYQIARAKPAASYMSEASPEKLLKLAHAQKEKGNMGLAFTYNEPLINFEYIYDSFRLCRDENLETVLVSNGQIKEPYLREILPLVTAWNIDLKSFSEEAYQKMGGDLQSTLKTIELVSEFAHLEVTTLVVPGLSDDIEAFKQEVEFLAGLAKQPVLHISRYFPNYLYHASATPLTILHEFYDLAKEHLDHVYLGNVF